MENNFKNSEVAKLLVRHSRNQNDGNDHHVSDSIFHPVKSYTLSNFPTNYSKQLDDFCTHNNFSSSTKRHNQNLKESHFMPSHAHNYHSSSFKPSTDSASSDIYPFPRNNTFNGPSTSNQTANNDDLQLNKWPLMDLSVKKQTKTNFEMRHLLKSQSSSPSNHSKNKSSDDSNSENGNKSNSKDESNSEKEGEQIKTFIKKESLQEDEAEKSEKLSENMSVYGNEVPFEKAAVDSEQEKIECKEVSNQKDDCLATGSSHSTEKTFSSNKSFASKDNSQSNYFSPNNHSCLQSHQHLSSRSSIIKTNPVITSLLLVKHTPAHISPPTPAHPVKATSTQASDRSLHKNSYTTDNPRPERKLSQTNFVNSHEKYLHSEMPPHSQTSDALRSLLMKPSSLEDTKLKLNHKKVKSKVYFSTNEKSSSNLFNYDMIHKNIEKLECKDKDKKDDIYLKKDKFIKKLIVDNSIHQSCGGCGCGCDFCPQPLNDKHTQEKHSDVKEIKAINGFIVSNLNVNNLDFSNNLSQKNNETEKTVESLLLLKNGYRHNDQLIFSDIQKPQLLDNFYETRLYPGNNIYLYNKKQNKFNDKCFTLKKNENTDRKKENSTFEKTVSNPPSCCSSKSPKSMQKNDSKHDSLKEKSAIESKKSTFCLSKRKFMELKNKPGDATCCSEEASQANSCCAPKSPADDCNMPCCKRSRNASSIVTNPYTLCQGACNPASCFCSGSQADCSMETCRRAFGEMPENTLDSNSLSDNSTVSVSSCKSEPENKFTSSFSVNVSTQWSIDDLEDPDLYKDFSVQCSIVEQPVNTSIELEKCMLCNCCLPAKNSSLSTPLFRLSPPSADKQSRASLTVIESDGDEVELKTPEGQLRCAHCGISFDDEVIFSIHMGSHSHQDPFTCNLCGKKCFNKYGFNTHILHGHHFVS